MFATGEEIEEVNRHMLDKLLNEDDFVAVYFCKCHYFPHDFKNITQLIGINSVVLSTSIRIC